MANGAQPFTAALVLCPLVVYLDPALSTDTLLALGAKRSGVVESAEGREAPRAFATLA